MLKRLFDLAAAGLGLLILLPVLVLVAVVVRLKLGSPVFFTQQRPGKNGKPFFMIKFRTMTNERDENGELLPNEQRISRFGKNMRASSLDELPELYNVLKGEMSLVGPRPLRMQYLDRYNSFQKRRHEVKPGITGWAQVNGRNTQSWEERFNQDVWYVDNQSFILDLKIIFLTVVKVIKREGVSPEKNEFMQEFKGSESVNE